MPPARILRALIAIAIAAAAFALPARAQQLDVIRGQVVGPENKPLEDAKVTATSLSGNVNRSARTDRNGRYTITFPGGEGDYFVEVSAIGYAARRFEVKRTADQEILVADAKLLRAAGQLETVKVTGQRDRPERNDATPDISGSERPVDNAAVPADQQGDIAAMAASLPGVTLVPGQDGDPSGFSVLGLSPDQNNTTLNGMNFGGSNLPRDANVSTSLVMTPYDVSRGGFSGAQFQIRGRPGSNGPIAPRNRSASSPATSPSADCSRARSSRMRRSSTSPTRSAGGPTISARCSTPTRSDYRRRASRQIR